MRYILASILATILITYANAISFSEGGNLYVPSTNSIIKYSAANLGARSTISVASSNQISTTFDGAVDRVLSNLLLFSGSGESWFITKVGLSTFSVLQSVSIPRQPVANSVMTDNTYVYWIDNAPGSVNSSWVRVAISDITGAQSRISLIGLVTAVGPRPDPRAGFNPATDLVAYFTVPNSRDILQRASTSTFTTITPIPVPTINVVQVQNGLAYDLATSGSNQVVNSYTFLTSALNATGNSAAVTTTADTVTPLQEDFLSRGFLNMVLSSGSSADKRFVRYTDNTLVKTGSTFTLASSANVIPKVTSGIIHYTSGNNLYVYNVADGTQRTASLTTNSAGGIKLSFSVIVMVAIIALLNM